MCVTTLDRTMESVRQVADVKIEGVNGVEVTLGGAIFGDIIAADGDAPPTDDDVKKYPHLQGIEFPKFPARMRGEIGGVESIEVGVIVSAELSEMWQLGEKKKGQREPQSPWKVNSGGVCLGQN